MECKPGKKEVGLPGDTVVKTPPSTAGSVGLLQQECKLGFGSRKQQAEHGPVLTCCTLSIDCNSDFSAIEQVIINLGPSGF